jgi:hypothetical protein
MIILTLAFAALLSASIAIWILRRKQRVLLRWDQELALFEPTNVFELGNTWLDPRGTSRHTNADSLWNTVGGLTGFRSMANNSLHLVRCLEARAIIDEHLFDDEDVAVLRDRAFRVRQELPMIYIECMLDKVLNIRPLHAVRAVTTYCELVGHLQAMGEHFRSGGLMELAGTL